MRNKKVVLGMSGGVDSSTTAYLLKEEGYEIYGVTLSFDVNSKNSDFDDAKRLAEKLGIEHRVVDMSESFNALVVDYFIDEYSSGMTPSPCVICDEKVKFKILNDVAIEVCADNIATGHYAMTEYSSEFNERLLKVATDRRKDQSYMLYRLGSDIIDKLIFPLFKYTKAEVREIARKNGIEVANKPDSQGICFAKEGYVDFLKSRLGDKIKRGNFVLEDGTIMGEHAGYQLFTIGQRRGLGVLFPRAYFVTKIDPSLNEVTLGEWSDLMRDEVILVESTFTVPISKLSDKELIARPRFSSHGLKCRLEEKDGKIVIKFSEVTAENSPGQHLVLYYKDFVVGGGKIVF